MKLLEIMTIKNLRNTMPKRLPALLGGDRIDYGHHPWAGLWADSNGTSHCSGSEHEFYIAKWRLLELLGDKKVTFRSSRGMIWLHYNLGIECEIDDLIRFAPEVLACVCGQPFHLGNREGHKIDGGWCCPHSTNHCEWHNPV